MNSVLPSGGHVAQNTQQESHRSHLTSTRQTGRGNSSRDREEDEVGIESQRDRTGSTGGENEHGTTEMKSQYQKDFPPPSSCRRRRTPAHPQPDNIGINPAFGLESVCQCLSAVDRRRAAHQCLCFFFDSQVRVLHSPERDLPWMAHHESQVCRPAESGLVRTTTHDV